MSLDWGRTEPTEEEVLARLQRDAGGLVAHFRLPLARLTKESSRVKRRYGSCDSDGVIRIRLRNQRTGKFLKYSSMIATLCHELAHLRYMNHGPRFVALYTRILEFARADGIYRPRPVAPRAASPRPGQPAGGHPAAAPRLRREGPDGAR
ncbi:MAG: M48 family metallopeptidase [Myxococcota bacterium]